MQSAVEYVGLFDRRGDGGGALRDLAALAPRREDPAVSGALARELDLRGGERVVLRAGRKVRSVADIASIDGEPPTGRSSALAFAERTAIDPSRSLRFETCGGPTSMRIVDLFTPVGFGQRGIIVAPPRCGKTVLLHELAHGAATNYPELTIMVLLVDERPEEVTDMIRNVPGEVFASSNDRDSENHVHVARLVIEQAKRLVERGRDVLLLLDSLTRLGRAFNHETRNSGRTLSGGIDARALRAPKSIFGAARCLEEGGSLTIVATALVGTGSRMDDVIFNEFKGTGNLELVLSEELAEQRIWPAIDLVESGTRREELLLTERAITVTKYFRRAVEGESAPRAMQSILDILRETSSNEELLQLGS